MGRCTDVHGPALCVLASPVHCTTCRYSSRCQRWVLLFPSLASPGIDTLLMVQVKPKNLTALQLPQLDIPVPEKPQIDLPSVPAVPVYQFQLPDIKTELESAVLPVVDKAKSLLPQVHACLFYSFESVIHVLCLYHPVSGWY